MSDRENKEEVKGGIPIQKSKMVGGKCNACLYTNELGESFLPDQQEGYEVPFCGFDLKRCQPGGDKKKCPIELQMKHDEQSKEKSKEKPIVVQLPNKVSVNVPEDEKIAA